MYEKDKDTAFAYLLNRKLSRKSEYSDLDMSECLIPIDYELSIDEEKKW